MSVEQNLTWHRGEDVLVEASRQSGTDDPTGWTLQFRVFTTWEAAPVYTVAGDAVDVTDGPAGEFTVTIPGASNALLARRTYFFDLRRVDAGEETVLAWGSLIVKP